MLQSVGWQQGRDRSQDRNLLILGFRFLGPGTLTRRLRPGISGSRVQGPWHAYMMAYIQGFRVQGSAAGMRSRNGVGVLLGSGGGALAAAAAVRHHRHRVQVHEEHALLVVRFGRCAARRGLRRVVMWSEAPGHVGTGTWSRGCWCVVTWSEARGHVGNGTWSRGRRRVVTWSAADRITENG